MTAPVAAVRDRAPDNPAELAERALAAVGRDPHQALRDADHAVSAGMAANDRAAASKAHRAAGLALRELGRLPDAERRLRTAARIADDGRAAQAAAEARMSLAFVLLDRGRVRTAFGVADQAAAGVTGLPAWRVACQRALILQRTGQLDAALAAYTAVLPKLRAAGDTIWLARLHNNRGLLLAHRGSLGQADADLAAAARLYADLGMDLLAAEAECNRGNVEALRGDATGALASYDRAERVPALQRKPIPQLLINRCQVLLSVGLFDDARRTAEHAVAELSDSGHRTDLAEAQLWLAEAAAAQGDFRAAGVQAQRARAAFRGQQRSGWALLARLVELRTSASAGLSGDDQTRLRRAADRCATQLAAAGWHTAELDARLIAAVSALRAGDGIGAARRLAEIRARGARGSIEMRVRGWHAEALRRRAADDRRGTLAALRAGLGVLDRGQAALGATDLRAHLSVFGVELAAMGTELAVASGDAWVVLDWAERSRARAMQLRPVSPPADDELAAALVGLRQLSSPSRSGPSGPTTPSTAARRAAEERVVRASRSTASPWHRPAGGAIDRKALVAALSDDVLVEFVAGGGDLYAVVLAGGRGRLVPLDAAAPAQDAVETAAAALAALATGLGTDRSRAALRAALDAACDELDDLLIRPLALADGGNVVLVPTGALHRVPWAALPRLSGRAVRVAPSAHLFLRAATRRATGVGVVLAAGPGVPGGRDEVAAIAALHPNPTMLLGEQASVTAVGGLLDGAGTVHLAAHGTLRVDNPLLSSIVLADGGLTVYDLERLAAPPDVVVLPACRSGVSTVLAGDELIGLVSALLTLGTRTVIAPVAPVSDRLTAPLMIALHERLRAGDAPAAALARACAGVDRTEPAAHAVAASFVCFGG